MAKKTSDGARQLEHEHDGMYQMPEVSVGQMVLWKQTVDSSAVPAIVTAIGHSSLHLSVIHPGYSNFLPVDGVKHITDPGATIELTEELGVWDYTDETKLLQDTLGLIAKCVETG